MLGLDVEVVISPVITIRHIVVNIDPRVFSALIFTSQNAVLAAAEAFDLSGMRAFVVGENTGAVARKFGMNVSVAGGNADHLVATITDANQDGLLRRAGSERSQP